MANVLIVAYLLIVLALIGVILLQRSEGGGLGMGSNSNGLMSVRGSANLLTRTTAILAALFFATAIGLTILSEIDNRTSGILAGAADSAESDIDAPTSVLDALNALDAGGDESLSVPSVPATTETTTTPATDPALAVPAETAPTATETPAATTEAPAATTEAPAASTEAPAATTEAPAASSAATPAAPATTTPAAPAN